MAKGLTNTGEPRSLRDSWRRLQPFIGASRGKIAMLVVSSTISGFAEAAILIVILRVAIAISNDRETATVTLGALGQDVVIGTPVLLVGALVLTVLRLVMEWFNAYLPARLCADVQARLRKETMAAYVRSTWQIQSVEREGHLQEILTTHVTRAIQSVQYFAQGITNGFNLLALVVSALFINLPGAVLIGLSGGALFFALRPLSLLAKKHAFAQSSADIDYANAISETTAMSQEVRVFGADETVDELLDGKVDAVTTSFFRVQYLGGMVPALYSSLALLVLVGGLASLYAFGSSKIVSLSATIVILIRALTYSQGMQTVYQKITGLSPYMDRIRDAQQSYLDNAVEDRGRPLPRVDQVAFRDAGFSYVPGTLVLDGVTVTVDRGVAVGIVGPSGAGKSTFVQLLLRLRDPETGLFLINGEDAREFSLADWYQRIAFVPQDCRVLSGTVAENIRFFREHLDREAIEHAARRASIHDEIMSWPKGYDTPIGQRADAVSGGQRQRICMARALANDPDIIVLDEPTSSLDVKSEAGVQSSLQDLKGDVTLFIVAHRLSTLSICDQIMVFRDGRLDAFDSAAELTLSNDFFGEAVELSRIVV